MRYLKIPPALAATLLLLLPLPSCGKPRADVDLTIDPPTTVPGGTAIEMAGTWRMEGVTLVESREDPELVSRFLTDEKLHRKGRIIPPYDGYLLEFGERTFLRANELDLARSELPGILWYLNTHDGKTAFFTLFTTTPPGGGLTGTLVVRLGIGAFSEDLMVGLMEYDLVAPGTGREIPFQGTFRFNLVRVGGGTAGP